MKRINIQLTDEQEDKLRTLAFSTRLSVAEHVRRAVEQYLEGREKGETSNADN